MERLPMEHAVTFSIKDGKFVYPQKMECLCVLGGDTIKWALRNRSPWGIVIKAPDSPLNWSFKIALDGTAIIATVRRNAVPGIYRYGIGAFDGRTLLFDDPDIIVKRPK